MNISIEHLNYLVIYFGILLFAVPALLWLLIRVSSPTLEWNGTAESLDDRMVPISRRTLHHPGEVRNGKDRRLALDRRHVQANVLAI